MLKKIILLSSFLIVPVLVGSNDDNTPIEIIVKSSVQHNYDEGTKIGITNETSVLDIKKVLEMSEVISLNDQLLYPLYKKWWNFGLFYFQGLPLVNNNEHIKNVMKYYKTNIFYVHERKRDKN